MQTKILSFFICLFFTFALHANPPHQKTICLNMIVKDESHVIEKCLGSVKDLIDYWVIVDTGSTDGTQRVIQNFMKDIPGELHERPWVNFEHNRNEALKLAKNKADYTLFMDADELLVYSDNFVLPSLDRDFYHMVVRQMNAADVLRIALINNKLDWKWEGVLHECIQCPAAKSNALLTGIINLCNVGEDSGRTRNITTEEKYLKDAKVFEAALKKEPHNSRYMYYLGQSYLAAGKHDLARKSFIKRVAMQSADIQETYQSYYSLGSIEQKLENFEGAIDYFFRAYQLRQTRAEPLFRIATSYRQMGNILLGYLVSKYALSMPYPSGDVCIEYPVYDHTLLIEFANCSLLLGKWQEGLLACTQLLSNPNLPATIKPQVESNLQLAKAHLQQTVPMPHAAPLSAAIQE